MDYGKDCDIRLWKSWAEFDAANATRRACYLTTKTPRAYWDAEFRDGDFLLFGRETKGLPEPLLAANPERCLTIPMRPNARSLNLATSAGIVLYEALRQTRGFGLTR